MTSKTTTTPTNGYIVIGQTDWDSSHYTCLTIGEIDGHIDALKDEGYEEEQITVYELGRKGVLPKREVQFV